MWIDAPPRDLFDLVSDLGSWKGALPHYRYVKILGWTEGATYAAMGARRGLIPVSWEARQLVDPEALTIRFRHIRGVTRGMEVLWTFTPEGNGTRARVEHDLQFPVPFVGEWIAHHLIVRRFVDPIVLKTLGCFRALAEAETNRLKLRSQALATFETHPPRQNRTASEDRTFLEDRPFLGDRTSSENRAPVQNRAS